MLQKLTVGDEVAIMPAANAPLDTAQQIARLNSAASASFNLPTAACTAARMAAAWAVRTVDMQCQQRLSIVPP